MDLRILDCQIATRSKSKSRFWDRIDFLPSFDLGLAVSDLIRHTVTLDRGVDSSLGKLFRPWSEGSTGIESRIRRILVDCGPCYQRGISIGEHLRAVKSTIFRL